jgi:ADP-ribosylglycohydrolase
VTADSGPDRIRRALRSLNGLAVGDAVGCALTNPGAAEPEFGVAPWRYTDDTEMAIAIVDLLATRGEIDQDALALSFGQRFAAQSERGYGPVAYWILTRIAEGMPWREAASTPYKGAGSMGNGAAMRVAPLGAYFADAPDRAIAEAIRSAAVTHAHPQGQAGAAAVAFAATLLAGTPAAGVPALREVAGQVEDRELREALERAATMSGASAADAGRELGTGVRVVALETVPFALWAAFTQPIDYGAAISLTMSGFAGPTADKDTICAIVGGLVSISADPATIPPAWQKNAEPLPAIGTVEG